MDLDNMTKEELLVILKQDMCQIKKEIPGITAKVGSWIKISEIDQDDLTLYNHQTKESVYLAMRDADTYLHTDENKPI